MAVRRAPRTGRFRLSGLASFALAVVAVICCAGLPATAAAVGGLTLAWVLGAGAAVIGITALGGALLFVRSRRRRACPPEQWVVAALRREGGETDGEEHRAA